MLERETSSATVHPVLETLTSREREVLGLTSRGLTNAETAANLKLTIHAVKFHLASVFRKLDVANRTEAAALFINFAHSAQRRMAD